MQCALPRRFAFLVLPRIASGIAIAALASIAAPALAQVRAPTHVACVGDSITFGYMASSTNASYPSDLQRLFGSNVQVKNFGHSGATLLSSGDTPYIKQAEYGSANTFISNAGSTAVVDVVLMLGTNDSKAQNWMAGTATRAQQFVTDLTSLVDHFATLASHPVIYLMLPPRAFSNSYGISGAIIHDQIVPLIRQVATSKNAPVIDLDALTTARSDLFPDGVHPSDAGYQLVAQTVHDALLLPLTSGGQGGQGGRGGQAGGQGGQTGSGGQGGHVGSGGASGGGGGPSASGGVGGATASSSGGTAVPGTGGVGTGGGTGAGTGGKMNSGTGGGSGGVTAPGSGGGTGTGGATSSATGGSGGVTATGTGGVGGSGGAVNPGSGGGRPMEQAGDAGCSCALADAREPSVPPTGYLLLLLAALARRRRGARSSHR